MKTISASEFEAQFKSLYRPLCLLALRYTDRIDEAEDIVQQAFADVWDKSVAGLFIGNLKAYLFQAVRNRSLDAVQSANRETPLDELPDDTPDLSGDEAMARAERDARLWQAIDDLPAERRRIFLMAKRDGLSYREIADELRLSIKTVENQMSKALIASSRKTGSEGSLRLSRGSASSS